MVELHDALEVEEDAVVVRVGGCELFLVRPARGDGRYAVRELVDSEGRRCGVEVDFAEDAA